MTLQLFRPRRTSKTYALPLTAIAYAIALAEACGSGKLGYFLIASGAFLILVVFFGPLRPWRP